MMKKIKMNRPSIIVKVAIILIIILIFSIGINIKAESNEEKNMEQKEFQETTIIYEDEEYTNLVSENESKQKKPENMSNIMEIEYQHKKGIDGKNGRDGKNGKDGLNGIDGKDGRNGLDGKDGIDGRDGIDGKNGLDGKDGRDGVDGHTPIKGIDYFTNYDIEEMATKASEKVYQEHMQRIVEGVTLNLMKDGNITLSTYEKDVIETIVSRLMEESSSEQYIKDQVIDIVQHMISSSLAEQYNSSVIYSKGAIVTYNGNLYISNINDNNAVPGTDNSWNPTTLTVLLNNFNHDVASKLDEVNYNYIPDGKGSGRVVVTLINGGTN